MPRVGRTGAVSWEAYPARKILVPQLLSLRTSFLLNPRVPLHQLKVQCSSAAILSHKDELERLQS
jgi:hypothetical protein